MGKGRIALLGPIGTFKIGDKEYHGIQFKDVTVMVAEILGKDPKLSELTIDIAGPGGSTETGNAIYDYLDSLKSKGIKLITNQVDDIGSIDTKLFLVGDERVALDGINPETLQPYDFFIHNPWNTGVSGDADTLAAAEAITRAEEDSLATFYVNRIGVDENAIRPLMKMQTGFNAKEALAMKFATSIRPALKTAAYMETKKKSLVDGLLAALGLAEKVAAVAPPPELMGKPVTVDGKPAVDGVYSVKGGVVTALESLEEEVAEPAAAIPAAAAPVAVSPEVQKQLDELKALKEVSEQKEAASKIAALVKEQVTAGIEEFKSTLKVTHRPPHKDVIIDKDAKESPVAARNRENAEKRAKALKQ